MTFKGPFWTKGLCDFILWFYPMTRVARWAQVHTWQWLPQAEELEFLMGVTATATRLLVRKIVKYCMLWLENCLKNSKRQKCKVTDLQRWQGRDNLEGNQDKMVKRKGRNTQGKETNVPGRKPSERRRWKRKQTGWSRKGQRGIGWEKKRESSEKGPSGGGENAELLSKR